MTNFENILFDKIESIGSPFFYKKIANIDIFSVGCKSSVWDSLELADIALSKTMQQIAIIDTCSIINDRHILGLELCKIVKELFPEKLLFITGCSINYDSSEFKKYGICLSREDKFEKLKTFFNSNNKITCSNKIEKNTLVIKIQDGCKKNCAYCIEPKITKKLYSMKSSEIFQRIDSCIKTEKINKLQLIGTELTDYSDENFDFSQLCEEILLRYPSIQLNIGIIDPGSKQTEKIVILANKYQNMSKKIRLAVQSLSNDVLYMMKRRHNVDTILKLKSLAANDVLFMFDIIIGFPGETNEMLETTLSNLRKIQPYSISVLPYSDRFGTNTYLYDNKNNAKTCSLRYHSVLDSINQYNVKDKITAFDIFNTKLYSIYQKSIDFSHIHSIDYSIESVNDIKQILNSYNKNNFQEIMLDFNNINDFLKFGIYSRFVSTYYNIKINISLKLTTTILNSIFDNSFDLFVLLHTEHRIIFKIADDVDSNYIQLLLKFKKFVNSKYRFLNADIQKLLEQI